MEFQEPDTHSGPVLTNRSFPPPNCIDSSGWGAQMRNGLWCSIALAVALTAGCRGCSCTTTPSCKALKDCPSETVRVCGDKCVTPVRGSAKCSTDPCADNGFCAEGTCIDLLGNGNATCLPLGFAFGTECYPGENPKYCPNDLYCLDKACTVQQKVSHCTVSFNGDGASCDSDFAHPKCGPCQPGLRCTNGRCHKPCLTTDDCACDLENRTSYTCFGSSGNQPGLCYHCSSLGKLCDYEHPCCDTSVCSNPAEGAVCCIPRDGTRLKCSSRTQCCGGDGCFDGLCRACMQPGNSCRNNDECCTGLTCQSGVCKQPCSPGAPCLVANKKGPCARGIMDCRGAIPVCTQTVFPQPDTNCNGIDEDCDGIPDNGYQSHACTQGNIAGCQASFVADGKSQCKNGQETCNPDYCKSCDQSNKCGFCSFTPCIPGTNFCTPGYVCKAGNTVGCSPQDSSTACWPVQNCQGCPGVSCWKPFTVNVGGTCP